jgi:hypothetical protein
VLPAAGARKYIGHFTAVGHRDRTKVADIGEQTVVLEVADGTVGQTPFSPTFSSVSQLQQQIGLQLPLYIKYAG